MKKVIICTPSLEAGGAERFVVDLASKVDKDKIDVTVAVTRNMTDTFLKRTLVENKINVVDLSSNNYLRMLKNQILFLNKNKPDVIHANTGSMLHIMIACKLCRIPTKIYTVHNEAKLLFGNNKMKKILYRLAFSFFGFVPIAICPTVQKTLENEFKLNTKSIPMVKNGVDINRFNLSEKCRINKNVTVVSVGTLYWIKNQELAINTICNLKNKGYDVSLEILGDGVDKEKLQKLIERNHAEQYVTLHGRQEHVEDYLKRADIFLSTSRTEGLPLSILEAMSCGLPIIATAVGGVVDIVRDEINGYLVRDNNSTELENALMKLVSSQEKRYEFGRQSRVIAEQWSLNACVRGYEDIYERRW